MIVLSVPPSSIPVEAGVLSWYFGFIYRRHDEWDLWHQWYTKQGRRPRIRHGQVYIEESLVIMAMYLGIPEIEIIVESYAGTPDFITRDQGRIGLGEFKTRRGRNLELRPDEPTTSGGRGRRNRKR